MKKLFYLLPLLLLQSCGTIYSFANLKDIDNVVYHGLRIDVYFMQISFAYGNYISGILAILDMSLSLALDTALLPITFLLLMLS